MKSSMRLRLSQSRSDSDGRRHFAARIRSAERADFFLGEKRKTRADRNLEGLVSIESGSRDLEGLDKIADLIADN